MYVWPAVVAVNWISEKRNTIATEWEWNLPRTWLKKAANDDDDDDDGDGDDDGGNAGSWWEQWVNLTHISSS